VSHSLYNTPLRLLDAEAAIEGATVHPNTPECVCCALRGVCCDDSGENERKPISSAAQMSFPGRAVQRTWHLIDATDQTVGRLATAIAPLLKGKHKPTYRPNGDCGDYVVVINADQVSAHVVQLLRAVQRKNKHGI